MSSWVTSGSVKCLPQREVHGKQRDARAVLGIFEGHTHIQTQRANRSAVPQTRAPSPIAGKGKVDVGLHVATVDEQGEHQRFQDLDSYFGRGFHKLRPPNGWLHCRACGLSSQNFCEGKRNKTFPDGPTAPNE